AGELLDRQWRAERVIERIHQDSQAVISAGGQHWVEQAVVAEVVAVHCGVQLDPAQPIPRALPDLGGSAVQPGVDLAEADDPAWPAFLDRADGAVVDRLPPRA